MVALRRRPSPFGRVFWASAICATLAPTSIGHQDLAAIFARQPGVSQRWRDHLIASPFGTIHAATFSFSRPLGTAMPDPLGILQVNFEPHSPDMRPWRTDAPVMARPQSEYPTVNRRLKGDRMPLPQSAPGSGAPESMPQLQPIDSPSSRSPSPPPPILLKRPKSAGQSHPAYSDTATENEQVEVRETTGEGERIDFDGPPRLSAGEGDRSDAEPVSLAPSPLDGEASAQQTQLYFSFAAIGPAGGLEQWAPGAAPIPISALAAPEIKDSSVEAPADAGPGGDTTAPKGDTSRFKSPAVRLGLSGKPRAKAEKCVADAVYFEARGEPLRGQMAVAQVVMNRVFSGRYPNDVCGVVYQNAQRRLSCQFTFACEGKDLSRIDEPDMWEQAKRIAKDVLDGKFWLTEVGHATHYHAYWVHPSWVSEMAKLYKLGVHTFYRPRAWGDGSDAPIWANAPEGSKSLSAPTAKRPETSATREAAPAKTQTAKL
jgi:hypothetical protein